MITPDLITQALADDQAALTLLRAAVDQAAKAAIHAAHVRQKMLAQLEAAHEALLLEEIFEKLLAKSGKLLRAWDPTKTTFDAYISKIAGQHADDWCLERIIQQALTGNNVASTCLKRALDDVARPAIGAVMRWPKIFRRVSDFEADMDDLLSALFVKLWKEDGEGFRKWNRADGPFNAYFGTVAQNATIDKYRSRYLGLLDGDEKLADLADHDENPEAQVAREDRNRKILNGMRAKLKTPKEWEMFGLLIEQGLTVDEIIVIRHQMKPNGVHKWRADFKKLAEEVREKIDSDPEPPNRSNPGKKK